MEGGIEIYLMPRCLYVVSANNRVSWRLQAWAQSKSVMGGLFNTWWEKGYTTMQEEMFEKFDLGGTKRASVSLPVPFFEHPVSPGPSLTDP